MNEKFLKLKEEKQEKILKAAISEFAYTGYDRASTDNIVMNAKISKGSLFNYFINKQGLYEDVIEYIIAKLQKEVKDALEKVNEEDFYIRLKQLLVIKQEYIHEHALEVKVLSEYISRNSKADNKRVRAYRKIEEEYLDKYLITYLDLDTIRSDITMEDVLFVTNTLLQAVLRRQEEIARFDQQRGSVIIVERELDKYIDVLKYGIYKQKE